MLQRLVWAVALAAALVCSQPGWAQRAGTIQSIRIEGNERIEPATIQSYLTVAIGDQFDPVQLDQSVKDLFATGLFDDVQLRQEGGTLVVAVVENPIINRIAFEGNRRIDDEALEAEIQLRPRVVYTRARIQNAVNRVLEIYRRNGRFAATVEPKIVELPQNRVDVIFEINEGPLTGVERIQFVGNESFGDGALRGVVETRETRWWRFLSSSDAYDPDRLAFDQELLRRFYRARGYVEVQITSALAELTPDGTGFIITFTIDEGQRYDFGSIDVESNLRDLSPDELRGLVVPDTGDTFNADELEETIVAMTDRLGELGYAFVEIDPQLNINRETQTVDVVFVVDEGPRVYVERIEIIGNVRTLDRVIRREFRLAEGDAFNTALLRRSEERLRNLGFFESVETRRLPGSAPDRTIIEVQVAERSTGELSFGVGFSTQDGPLGDVRLAERNFLGRGQQISAEFTLSGRRQEIDFSFTEPWFLGYEFAAGFDLFSRRTDFESEASFQDQRVGGRIRGGYRLTERLRHDLRFTVQEIDIKDVDDDASVFIQDEEGSNLSVTVGQSLTYDRRNSPFLPSSGYILTAEQDIGIPATPSQYIRHEGSAGWYYPFTPETVLNLGARGGVIFGYGGDDVRLGDRFFIGGATLRGFKFAGIGPRDQETDDALGGNQYVTGTAEVRFPLGLPDEIPLFGRVFGEGGTLTGIDVNGPTLFDDDALRASLGLGVSWLSPLGPISVDLAQAVLKSDEDRTEIFRLSFGTRF